MGKVARRLFPAEFEAVREVCGFAVGESLSRGLAPVRADQVRLAVEEAAVNVFSYAYPEGGGELEVEVWRERGRIHVRLSDSGAPFDPLAAEAPDVARRVREGKPGGLGIRLIRGMSDGARYERLGNRNVLTLEFGGEVQDDP